jgi:hypothetical protein
MEGSAAGTDMDGASRQSNSMSIFADRRIARPPNVCIVS